MKLQKFLKSVSLCMVTAMMLSGCYPSGEVLKSTPSDLEDVEMTFKYTENVPESAPEIVLNLRKWDGDKLKEIFLEGSTINDEGLNDSTLVSESKHYYYMTSDKKDLVFEDGVISYTAQIGHFQNAVPSLYSKGMDMFFPDKEIEGFSSEEALKKIYELTDRLEIKNLGEPEIYAITVERANRIRGFEDLWTKNDEMYFIIFPIIYYDIPILTESCSIPGEGGLSGGSYVRTAISKSRLVLFECWNIFGEAEETGKEIPIKYNAQDIVNEFDSFLSGTEHRPMKIISCTLTYTPRAVDSGYREYTFRPSWTVEYYSTELIEPPLPTHRAVYDAEKGDRVRDYMG